VRCPETIRRRNVLSPGKGNGSKGCGFEKGKREVAKKNFCSREKPRWRALQTQKSGPSGERRVVLGIDEDKRLHQGSCTSAERKKEPTKEKTTSTRKKQRSLDATASPQPGGGVGEEKGRRVGSKKNNKVGEWSKKLLRPGAPASDHIEKRASHAGGGQKVGRKKGANLYCDGDFVRVT